MANQTDDPINGQSPFTEQASQLDTIVLSLIILACFLAGVLKTGGRLGIAAYFKRESVDPYADQQGDRLFAQERQGQDLLEDPIWSTVFAGDKEALFELIDRDPAVMDKRDAVGATPFLLLCLFNAPKHIEIVQLLAERYKERFPQWCVAQYTGDAEAPYTGENALHIAIINQNVGLAELLLQTAAEELLKHKATGKFFAPGETCYYGEYPLSFAVCSNQPDMIDLLTEYVPYESMLAHLTAQDSANGNMPIHMAVLSGRVRPSHGAPWFAFGLLTDCGLHPCAEPIGEMRCGLGQHTRSGLDAHKGISGATILRSRW